jgi:hypothetical protein
MIGAMASFAIGMLGIIGMIAIKSNEQKTGNPSLLSRASDKWNHIVHAGIAKIRAGYSYINRKNALFVTQYIVAHTMFAVRDCYRFVERKAMENPRCRKYIDMITGKGVIKKRGAVSLYLKKIQEEPVEDSDTATLQSANEEETPNNL